jgi:glycosyltransferase involved in cell wall biosynthesis
MSLRTLVIALDLPLPVTGGGDLRTLAIVRALARLGPVAVFGVHARRPEPSPIAGVAGWHSSSDTALSDPRAQARAALSWLRTADGHPCDRWWSARAAADLARLADDFAPDLVVVQGLWVHRYGEAIRAPGRRLVLNAENAEAALHEELAAADGHRSALARVVAQRVALRELAAVRAADRTWAPSALDADRLRAAHPGGDVRVDVVPSGIAVDDYAWPSGERGPVMVYPASFGYPPNVVAARRLVDGVHPRVRAAVPAATLMLVGAGLPAGLADRPGVEAPGRVPDMLPYLHRASVMALALTTGGGTRLKVLEALASGVAVVSTRKGVEGLDLRDGTHVLLAETDAQIAEGVLRVWNDDDLRTHLTTSGLALVRDRYGPEAVAAAVRAAVDGK